MGMKGRRRLAMVLGLLTGTVYGGEDATSSRSAATSRKVTGEEKAKGKKLSHDETLDWVHEHKAWRRAVKTKPIWARAVMAEEVGKEFQTADRVAERARAGYWLCVGVAGEPWFQKREKIEAKYNPAGEERKAFAFDAKPTTYQRFKPKATIRNWVAQVRDPNIAGFFIRPGYDPTHPLYSPAGGYVVRDDAKDPYRERPNDVWLVQEGLFKSTYEIVAKEK